MMYWSDSVKSVPMVFTPCGTCGTPASIRLFVETNSVREIRISCEFLRCDFRPKLQVLVGADLAMSLTTAMAEWQKTHRMN